VWGKKQSGQRYEEIHEVIILSAAFTLGPDLISTGTSNQVNGSAIFFKTRSMYINDYILKKP
jgi:hypothetical protein